MTGSDEKDGGSSGKLTVGKSSGEAALISPYYLHNNDNTGQVLTPILLNGTNYERWSKLMMNALRTKRKVGFLTGNFKRPANEGDDAERWDMVNSMIIGWIYSSVEPKLRSSISLVDDVSEMWSSLKSRFSVSDGTREHQLHADLTGCKQDGQTVEEYYGKLKILWDDIADIDKGFICCCGSSSCSSMKKYKKKQDGLRIHQFLMGLDNQKFGTTRSNLLSRLHELTLESVYSQIIQEERHIHATREPQEKGGVVGFSASASGAFKTQTSTCSHCGKTGHDKSQCYKIVGYPEWWNEPSHPNAGRGNSGRGRGSTRGRGRGRGPPFSASHVSAAVTTSSPTTGTTQLTDSQLTALADFVEKNKKSIGASKEGFPGKSEKLILYGTHSRFNLIIDSGASHHMTGDMSLLTEIQKIDPCPIKLPNDKITWATRYGTLLLGGKLILHHDQASRTLIGAGTERDGVYHLAGAVLPQSNRVGKADNRELWHRRMGHPSPKGESLSLLDNEPMHTNTSPIDTVAAQTTEPEGSIDPLQQTEEEEHRSVDPDTSLIDPTAKHVPESERSIDPCSRSIDPTAKNVPESERSIDPCSRSIDPTPTTESDSKEEEVTQTADIEELGIGKRKKMRSVLLEPYVTYSATQLDKPPHVDSLSIEISSKVSRGKQGIYISQRKYTLDIISECGMIGAKPVSTPIEQNHTLAKEEGEFHSDPTKYRRLVGRLVYLAIT
ncbi:unnamed protein product, partial [Arabidopsis halleri]